MIRLRSHAFEIIMVTSVIAAIVAIVSMPKAAASGIWILDGGTPSSSNWTVQVVGPNYDPVYVRAGRRIYVVEEDGGVRRCGR